MASELQFEAVVDRTQASKNPVSHYDRTVVFEFNTDEVKPIAVSIDYLYTRSDHFPIYNIQNYDKVIDSTVYPPVTTAFPTYTTSVDVPKNQGHNVYMFIDRIRELAFKYGIKNEFYKNKYGKWIDLSAIRPHFSVKRYDDNIFSRFYTGLIDDRFAETSIYTKVCDSPTFECVNQNDYFVTMCQVKDVNRIPDTVYLVKDVNSGSAFMYDIGRGDGSYVYENCEVEAFTNAETDPHGSLRATIYPRFTYKLANADTKEIAHGTFIDNNNHLFNDLLLTFTDSEGNPYTSLDNLFITVNGMVVGYKPGTSDNQIYIPDVVKYASMQIKGTKENTSLDSKLSIEESVYGENILNYDLDSESAGYCYDFDIQIKRWKGVTVTSIIEPLDTGKILKTPETEDNKSYWLTRKLIFNRRIDKDKTVLLCGNTIVDKDSWYVDENGAIILKNIEAEFDLIYSEVYRNVQIYLESIVGHSISGAPDIKDFLKENMSTEEDINKAYEEYQKALDEWKNTNGSDTYHYYHKSPFVITVEQFKYRQYGIIEFGSENSETYDINVLENHSDIILNRPVRDQFINRNWSPDDTVVMNGISHRFVNIHEDVFIAPDVWYRHGVSGIFDGANAYKLAVVRHDRRSDAYHKLNYTELLRGPLDGVVYYLHDDNRDTYHAFSELKAFEKHYLVVDVTPGTTIDKNIQYFTKTADEYIPVPSTITVFQDGETYYTCYFDKDYFLKK